MQTLKHGFVKVDNMHYTFKVTEEIFKKLDDIVTVVSRDQAEKFMDVHNQVLLDTLLTRYISALFLETDEIIDNHYGMAVIDVTHNERTFRISIGDVQVSKEQSFKISGIIYDN